MSTHDHKSSTSTDFVLQENFWPVCQSAKTESENEDRLYRTLLEILVFPT